MADDKQNDVKDEVAELAPFDPSKKKKKKKPVVQDGIDDSAENLAEKVETLSVSEGLESTFTGLKKKKKKPAEVSLLNEESVETGGEDLDDLAAESEEGEGIVLQQRYPWEGSDRDYEYEELLGRVFNILRENNPELAGDRRRTVMRPPQVLREGTKKTVFVNFMDLCKTMHRNADHVQAFLLAELGTSGSLDGQQRLVVKGRFAPKNFEGILRRYVSKYLDDQIFLLLFEFATGKFLLLFLFNLTSTYCFQMNMLSALGAKVLTQYFRRRIDSSFSDVRSVALDDRLHLSKLVLLLVLGEGMLELELASFLSILYLDIL
ncbi:hypothetical protein Dsin_028109 [Dipteronia sinensis]|uniref:Eukaryotic translation initiation factor 2 subunit beta n=1 Tax=Dipteronia sinensis TaxID=43782 RepID=A0AAD9ZPS0_9ROSI|nr:hypothetical protein Dsin_028109 [Dipteronia sinensis]